MRIMEKKELKAFVRTASAEDLTQYGPKKMKGFLQAHSIERIGCCCENDQTTGCLLRDMETGKLYAIIGKTAALKEIF